MKLQSIRIAASMIALSGVAFAGGSVKGKITFDGAAVPAPASVKAEIEKHADKDICLTGEMLKEDLVVDAATKGIKYCFVSIEKVTGGKTLEVPTTPIVSDQKSCHFTPHVLVVPKGSKVEFKNSDSKLHNTNLKATKNAGFNEGIPAGKSITKEFKEKENIKITCDVHPWMVGWLVVTDTPYYAVTEKDGSFEIKDLPAGKWKMRVWHETLGKMDQEVTVTEGQATAVDLKMAAKGAN